MKYRFPAEELQLFLAKKKSGQWLNADEAATVGEVHKSFKPMITTRRLNYSKNLGDNFQSGEGQVHVLVVVPEYAAWYGIRGSKVWGEGISLEDSRTLSRCDLVSEIIRRLEERHVLLVESSSMSGKSSLALLVCESLNKQAMGGERLVVFNVKAITHKTFESSFEGHCKVGWDYASTTLPQQEGCVVYLVVDEVEIYSRDPQRHAVFWTFVESILSNASYNIRILMFGDCDFEVDNMIPTLGIGHLNYADDEVFEYFTKWFNDAQCLAEVESSLNSFCVLLKWLTGGNVGLCLDAITALNVVVTRYQLTPPSPDEWIRILQTGTLRQRSDLYETLVNSRAVDVLDTLSASELGKLERILYGSDPDSTTVQKCLRKGILVRTEVGFAFSSPVMGQYFVGKCFGHIVRAIEAPDTLSAMIGRVMHAIDYNTIRQSLGRSASSNIPLEGEWQAQFFLAAIRCTQETLVVSTNVGSLFGIRGFVDFSIHGDGVFWALELLRERIKFGFL